MSARTTVQRRCPQCNQSIATEFQFRPWHIRGRAAAKAYVESLGLEAREWLLALYVDEHLQLLAVETVARGTVGEVIIDAGHIVCRGRALGAAGFILVHNHPSGDPTPSETDIRATIRVARASADLDMPLLDHLVIAGDRMVSVGFWGDVPPPGAC